MNTFSTFSLRAVLLLSLSVTFVASATPASEPLPTAFFPNLAAGKQQTVVVYGTSLTYGTSAANRAEWPKAMQAWFEKEFPGQVNFLNAASSGKDSNWGVRNLAKRVLASRPDLVFIEFSMNDSATIFGISLEQSEANLDRMVTAIRAQNPRADVVLQTMNTVWDSPAESPERASAKARPKLDVYYDVYRNYARKNKTPLIDHEPAWRRLMQQDQAVFRRWIPDGTHPIPEGSLAVTWANVRAMLEKARTAAANPRCELSGRIIPEGGERGDSRSNRSH